MLRLFLLIFYSFEIGVFQTAWSHGVNEPIARRMNIKNLELRAVRNQNILDSLNKNNFNCCDARSQIVCEKIMFSKNGLSLREIKWSETDKDYFLPLKVRRLKNVSEFEVMGLILEHLNSRPVHVVRVLTEESNGIRWITKYNKDVPFFIEEVVHDEAVPLGSAVDGGVPPVCIVQSGLPRSRDSASKKSSTEFWCTYKDKFKKHHYPNMKFNQQDVCVFQAVCKKVEPLSEKQDAVVGCQSVDGVCPPATYCALDPTVIMGSENNVQKILPSISYDKFINGRLEDSK